MGGVCLANYVDVVQVLHVHMLISLPSHLSEYIKGRSSKEFQELRNGTVIFMGKGIFCSNARAYRAMDVQKYIEEQEAHHKRSSFYSGF